MWLSAQISRTVNIYLDPGQPHTFFALFFENAVRSSVEFNLALHLLSYWVRISSVNESNRALTLPDSLIHRQPVLVTRAIRPPRLRLRASVDSGFVHRRQGWHHGRLLLCLGTIAHAHNYMCKSHLLTRQAATGPRLYVYLRFTRALVLADHQAIYNVAPNWQTFWPTTRIRQEAAEGISSMPRAYASEANTANSLSPPHSVHFTDLQEMYLQDNLEPIYLRHTDWQTAVFFFNVIYKHWTWPG